MKLIFFHALYFAILEQNELDIKKCDVQIPRITENLHSPKEVRGNNRLTAVIDHTLIISQKKQFYNKRFSTIVYYSTFFSNRQKGAYQWIFALKKPNAA